ncbi:uncharacterized protein LOC128234737 [Mya arenaria]|uniref:uncharacterized protein LOC128234737 n=1 Tax=Mya arenaria TaxID=6604 RepID=UPI0022E72E1A|nr:uncharacterized protein LOC128234737 [Mya arenaria]
MCTEKDRAVPPAVGCPSTTHVRMSPTSTTISIVAANSGVQDMRLRTFSGFGLSRRTLLDCPSQSGVASGAPSAPVRDTKWKSSVVNLVVDRSCPGPAEMVQSSFNPLFQGWCPALNIVRLRRESPLIIVDIAVFRSCASAKVMEILIWTSTCVYLCLFMNWKQ